MSKLGKGLERMMKASNIVSKCTSEIEIVKATAQLISITDDYDDSTVVEYTTDKFDTKIYLVEGNSVDGIYFADKFIDKFSEPILTNYANYTHPGGGFIRGAYAQEEFLCHHSLLYSVLEGFNSSWYSRHRKDPNGLLFRNEALVSSSIPFARNFDKIVKSILETESSNCDDDIRYASVLTIAAPINLYNDTAVKMRENKKAFINRIEFMFKVAANHSYITANSNFITGPFGCGAFEQNPNLCASVMRRLIDTEYKGVFENIIFAIPDRNSDNYKAFKEAFPDAIEIKA
jgi:uncharacterized protein (TIGR02452 family)